jgi:hypothetical protein
MFIEETHNNQTLLIMGNLLALRTNSLAIESGQTKHFLSLSFSSA